MAATLTNNPTIRSTRLSRVRSCGVRSCKAIASIFRRGRQRQLFQERIGTLGKLGLTSQWQPSVSFNQRKLAALIAPGPEIVAGHDQGYLSSVHDRVAIG